MKRIVLVLIVALTAAVAVKAPVARSTGAMRDVERENPVRTFAPRFSVDTEYQGCTRDALPADSTVPRETCGDAGDLPLRLDPLATAEEFLAPDSLQASGLVQLLWWDGKEPSLNAAIQRLTDGLGAAHNPVPLLVDLSAAHLVKAERMQTLGDLTQALEYAAEALDADSANEAALFNAALAAQALTLDAQAIRAWDAYLAVDSTSDWADEARQRRKQLRQPPEPPRPTTASTREAIREYAENHPQQARELGWDRVLGEWGSAVLHDSLARADSLLRLAEQLGTTLEQRRGDASLAEAVRAIRATRDAAARHRLAEAHRAYAEGQAQLAANKWDEAQSSLARALELGSSSPTLIAWARLFHVRAALPANGRVAALADLESLLARTDSVRNPALAARTHWMLGALLPRGAQFQEPIRHFRSAAQTFKRLGEREYFGMMRTQEGFTLHTTGQAVEGYRMVHEGLSALRPYRSSHWLNSALFDLARYTAGDGMQSAAVVIHDEAYQVARRTANDIRIVEGLLGRVEMRAATGKLEREEPELDSASARIQAFDSIDRKRFETQLQFARALMAAGRGGSAIGGLDSVIAYFSATPHALWRMAALMYRADLNLAAENWELARLDLDSITAQVRRMTAAQADNHLRAAIIEQARTHFDRLVMLHVRAGRLREALLALEAGRVSFTAHASEETAERIAIVPGQVALEYALVGDTLLTWVVRPDSLILRVATIDRGALLPAIRDVNRALEAGRDNDRVTRQLEDLHEQLIRPIQDRLGGEGMPLVVIADGEIASAPFGALADTRQKGAGRYLVETHPLRFANSLADAAQPAREPDLDGLRALLIADPAFTVESRPELDPLDAARAEMDSLLRIYPGADTLSGTNATLASLRTHTATADVIHFAGHAVFDDARPERSFLVMAGTELLPADSVRSMDLGRARLVVLSACSAVRGRQGRSGGFAGLSEAMLSAGAGGVVGALWKVDDQLTQRLMTEFHRAYARSGDPVQALRQAQVWMLEHGDEEERSPAAWAAFRYVGR